MHRRLFASCLLAGAMAFSGAAHAQRAGSWDGTWSGNWGGLSQYPASIVVSGGRVVQYLYQGAPAPVGRSKVTGAGLSFGTGQYTISLVKLGPSTASAQYAGPTGAFAATLTRD